MQCQITLLQALHANLEEKKGSVLGSVALLTFRGTLTFCVEEDWKRASTIPFPSAAQSISQAHRGFARVAN
jgi:hypothetical protein